MSTQIVDIEDRHLQARLALGCHTFECRQISIAPRCDTNYEIIRPWMKRTRSRQEAKASLRYSARRLRRGYFERLDLLPYPAHGRRPVLELAHGGHAREPISNLHQPRHRPVTGYLGDNTNGYYVQVAYAP